MRSTLLLCISTLCFLTRITCAAVPAFEDATPSTFRRQQQQQQHHARRRQDNGTQEDTEKSSEEQPSSIGERYYDGNRIDNLARHVQTRIQQCLATTPEGHGLLVHIDLSRTRSGFVAQDDGNGNGVGRGEQTRDDADARLRKRLLETVVKTWKNMPAEQRIAAFGTALSIATVPAWLIGSVQGLAESTIKKAKVAAAKAEVLRSMAPAAAQGIGRPAGKSKRQDVEPIADSHSSLHPSPDRYGDADEDVIVNIHLLPRGGEAAAKYIKVPSSASRVLVEFEDMIAHGGKALGSFLQGGVSQAAAHAATVSHAASHASSMSHGVSQAVSKAAKSVNLPAGHIPGRSIPKEENKTVKKMLQYAGAASPIIYFPAAMISFGNADKSVESKGDLTKYRRSEDDDEEDRSGFPLLTCVPIAKVEGIDSYVIPAGGLDYEAPIDDDWRDAGHFSGAPFSVTFAKRGLSPAAVSKIPNPLKLLGVGTMATSIGYIMHRMNQRRDADGSDGNNGLIRRSEPSLSRDGEVELEKRYTGRIFFAGLLAGTALSKAGFGVPKLKPTIVETQRRAADEDTADLLRKRGLKEGVMRVGRDKVTIALGAMVTGFAAVKSGIAGKIKNAVFKPKTPAGDGVPQLERRSIAEEAHSTGLQKRMNRAVTAVLAAVGGVYLAQRTGRRGQERENVQYEAQLAKLKVNQPGAARRSANDEDEEGVRLVRRGSGGGAGLKKALSYADDLAHSAGKSIGKLLHGEATPLERTATRVHAMTHSPSSRLERLESVASSSSGRHLSRGRSLSRSARSTPRVGRSVTVKRPKPPKVSYTETHHYYHGGESAAAEVAAHAGGDVVKGAAKKSTMGKSVALLAAGTVAGGVAHHMYENKKAASVAAAANAADAATAAPVEELAAAEAAPVEVPPSEPLGANATSQPAPKKRGLEDDFDDVLMQKRGGNQNRYNLHQVHHHLPGPQVESMAQAVGSSAQKAKGVGKVGTALLLVGGIVSGVLGHAIFHNMNAVRAEKEAAKQQAPLPDIAPLKKRDLDGHGSNERADVYLQARDVRSTIAKGIFGAFGVVTVGATAYAMKHDNPGVRKKVTVPAGSFVSESAGKRSPSDGEVPQMLRKRGFGKLFGGMAKKLGGILSKGGKRSTAAAVATGVGLSTGAALLDPGQAEEKPKVRRSFDDSESSLQKRSPQGKLGVIGRVVKAWTSFGAKRGPLAQKGVIVGAAAFGAGATGMLRKRASADGEAGDYEYLEKRLNGSQIGKMIDVGTVAMAAGGIVKGVIHVFTKKKAPAKPGAAAAAKREFADISHARQYVLARRSLAVSTASTTELKLLKREPKPFFGLARMAVKAGLTLAKGLKKRSAFEKTMVKRSDDFSPEGEMAKRGMLGNAMNVASLASTAAPLLKPVGNGLGKAAKGIGNGFKKLGGLFHKRSIDREAGPVAVSARDADRTSTTPVKRGWSKFISTASISTIGGTLLAPVAKMVFGKKKKPPEAGAAPVAKRAISPSYSDYLHVLKDETAEKLSKTTQPDALVKRADPPQEKSEQTVPNVHKPAQVETHVHSSKDGVTVSTKITFHNATEAAQ